MTRPRYGKYDPALERRLRELSSRNRLRDSQPGRPECEPVMPSPEMRTAIEADMAVFAHLAATMPPPRLVEMPAELAVALGATSLCIMHSCPLAPDECTDPMHLRIGERREDGSSRPVIDERGEPVRHAGTEAERG